jgi:predicted phosphodiesterase
MLFIGDIHGAIATLGGEIARMKVTGQTLIQVGDFGIGFHRLTTDTDLLDLVNGVFQRHDVKLLVIRGNHDNPAWFDGSKIYWSNIEFLPDYSVREVEGKKILFIGGAISIDRTYRTEGKDYWEEEDFILDRDKLSTMRGIDMVVTHTAPSFVYPIGCDAPIVNSFAKVDLHLKPDLIAERNRVASAYRIIRENNDPKEWIYGHFHASHSEVYEGCKFTLLNIGETYQINP